ncbi:MAG: DoxX family protein [Acidobacteria bacterium]|nr:DoxX family protein [Acidobacteriota bacterium]MCW5947970.1 DoxX family protein [Pyrinomonadaceae bacterium]
MNIILWILQILLALLFAFAGISKFMMSPEEMAAGQPFAIPTWFIYFIGVCETLGAIGLVVPWLTGIKPHLTPMAAYCLMVIMIGAVFLTAAGNALLAAIPLTVGILCFIVGRTRSKQL